jgi:hypothetical protein
MLSKAAYRHLSRMTSLAELASFLKANAPKTRKSVKLARGRKQEKALSGRRADGQAPTVAGEQG